MSRNVPKVLASFLLLSCTEKVCTLIGCQDGVTLDYAESPLDDMPYDFEVTTPEGTSTCHLEPVDAYSFDVNCEGDLNLTVGPTDLTVYGTPSEVSVTLTVDGEVKGLVSVEPTYEDYFPNGEHCDETPCRVDTIPVEFSAP